MRVILVYLVTTHHLRNFYLLKKIYQNYKFVILHENNIKNFKNDEMINKYLNFNIKNIEFSEYLKKNKHKIFFSFLSTLQIRKSVLVLYKNLIINNIPIFTIQETHQMYLHNENQNNYILPSDILFVCSNFEKEIFQKYNYSSNKIEISGWPYNLQRSDKVINNKTKYCLLLLNASKEVNPISIETKKIQKKIIKLLSKNIPKEYMLYVKQHPSDEIKNFNLTYKNTILLKNEIEIRNLIEEANIIISTGYTQAVFEAILLQKDIYIIDLNETNQIILNIKKENIVNLNNDIVLSQKNFNKNNYLQIIKINNLSVTYDQICSVLEKKIFDFFNLKKENYIYEKSISLIIWLAYLNEKEVIKSFFLKISDQPFYNNLKYIYNILVEENFNEETLIYLFNEYGNTNLFFPIKYIVLKKMIRNNINFSLVNNKFLEYFFVNDFKYLRSIFYNDLQLILFKLSTQKNKFYYHLEQLDSNYNNDLLLSKNRHIKFLILLRKKNFFFNKFFFKFIIFFLNLDKKF